MAATRPMDRRQRAEGRRPLRVLSAAAIAGCALAPLLSSVTAIKAFCGLSQPQLRAELPEVDGGVAMSGKSGRWQGGKPNVGEINRRRQSVPTLNNMKDQYFIIWARSQLVKNWYPINIISGAEAAKGLKSVADNNVAKAVGVDKLAEGQIVKAIGMSLYKQKDEVKKEAIKMHPPLKYASELEFGFKEILNNTKFNDEPMKFLTRENITRVPPEDELRNLLDDAGEAISNAGTSITKAGDNVKGFFSNLGSGR